jgi:hypothetical protein
MKIQMLRNPAASLGCDLKEGETGSVETPVGEKLIAMGIAVEVVPAGKTRGVSEKPTVIGQSESDK